MDTPPKIVSPQDCVDLSIEEIQQILEFYNEAEKDAFIQSLKDSNRLLTEKIKENESLIKMDQKMNTLFLKRLWNTLNKEEKKQGARFFKELHDKINIRC